jgi:hypothetical protein
MQRETARPRAERVPEDGLPAFARAANRHFHHPRCPAAVERSCLRARRYLGAGRGRPSCSERGRGQHGADRGDDLLGRVLLHEVAGARDRAVRLSVSAWDQPLHRSLTAGGDRVLIGERRQERRGVAP